MMKATFICPLKCGYFTSESEEILTHVNKKCSKRLLLGKDMKICPADPTKISAPIHISECPTCNPSLNEIKKNYQNNFENVSEYQQKEHKIKSMANVSDDSFQFYSNVAKYDNDDSQRSYSNCRFEDSMWEEHLPKRKEKATSKNSTNDTMVDCKNECIVVDDSISFYDKPLKYKKSCNLDDTMMSHSRTTNINDTMMRMDLNKKKNYLDDSFYGINKKSQNFGNIQERDAFDSTFFNNDNNIHEKRENTKVIDPFKQSDYFNN
jgi:hypothetical protein